MPRTVEARTSWHNEIARVNRMIRAFDIDEISDPAWAKEAREKAVELLTVLLRWKPKGADRSVRKAG